MGGDLPKCLHPKKFNSRMCPLKHRLPTKQSTINDHVSYSVAKENESTNSTQDISANILIAMS